MKINRHTGESCADNCELLLKVEAEGFEQGRKSNEWAFWWGYVLGSVLTAIAVLVFLRDVHV